MVGWLSQFEVCCAKRRMNLQSRLIFAAPDLVFVVSPAVMSRQDTPCIDCSAHLPGKPLMRDQLCETQPVVDPRRFERCCSSASKRLPVLCPGLGKLWFYPRPVQYRTCLSTRGTGRIGALSLLVPVRPALSSSSCT